MKKKRLIDRTVRGRHRIIEVRLASDWRSRNPFAAHGDTLPYFWHRFEENTIAEVHSFGAGPLALMWAYSK